MLFHAFLIKYAEIAIKGKNRYLFEDALVKQMRLALDTNVKVRSVRGKNKVEIEFSDEEELAHIVELLAGPRSWSD